MTRSLGLALASWSLSRSLMLVLLVSVPGARPVVADVQLYAAWSEAITSGAWMPFRDGAWEYPPLNVLPLALAGSTGRPLLGIVVLLCLADLVLVAALRCVRTRDASWIWMLYLTATALAGPVVLLRLDVLSVLATVAALTLLVLGSPVAAGALLAIGAGLKVWPAVLIPLAAARDRRVAVGGIAATLAAVSLLFPVTGLTTARSVLDYQAERGLHVESVAGTPFAWVHLLGADVGPVYGFASWQWQGGGADGVAATATIFSLLVVLFVWIGSWEAARREHLSTNAVVQIAAALVLLLVVTNKVLSPQYLLWCIGTMTVALALDPWRRRSATTLLLCACAATQVLFPASYGALLDGELQGALALTVRNVLLLSLTVVQCRRALRALRTPAECPPDAVPANAGRLPART